MRKRALLVPTAVLALALAACGGTSGASTASGTATAAGSSSSAPRLSGTLTVFAAASLTGVFTDLGNRLEKDNPGLTVRFNFAGSSALATQLTQGAPADVFASADQAQMDVVTKAGLQKADPRVFTQNVLEIAVPRGNPGHVTGLADFAKPDLTIAVCAPQVPCGAAAQKVFQATHTDAKPDTQEQDVKAALTKVELGEVDAALVYATDVQAAGGRVEGISFPEAQDAVNTYPLCVLKSAPDPAAAQAFVDLVRSKEGQQALADAGFRAP
jgi:molybdate transport system substrate-binding protein